VGWRSLSGWVADAGRGAPSRGGGGRGKCTLEEAVGIGRQWERSRESLELRKGEDAGEEEESHGMDGKEDRARGSRDRETAEVGVKNPTRN